MAKRISEKEIFKSKLFSIKDVDLEFNTGKTATYQILEKKDTAMLVPIDNDGNLYLIREYYPAIDEYQLCLPKGRIESGEDPVYTANKELQEEIGFKSENIVKLGVLTMSPGYLTQKTYVFIALDLVESKLDGDEEEPIEIIKFKFSEFENLINDGKLTEARAISALYLAKNYLEKLLPSNNHSS